MIHLLRRGMLAALVMLFLVATSAQGQTCDTFVTTAGSGSGASFADATDLQGALGGASSGDVICVASGVYSPGNTQSSTFNIPEGVTVVGGFAGSESGSVDASQRVANYHAVNPTTLDGDWDNDSADAFGDDTANYSVVTFNATATLDGVIVTGGNESRAPSAINANGVGGGIKVDGGISPSVSPTIQNSVLRGNSSSTAGASISGVNAGYTLINVLITESGGAPDAASVVAAASGRTGLLAAAQDYQINFINVTIAGNGGQAFFDAEAGPTVTLNAENSIFYNNALDLPANSATFQETQATLTNVIFEQESTFCVPGGVTCNNVSGADPNLRTSDGFFTLTSGSSALDFGDQSLLPAGVSLDGAGRARVQGADVDAGAYEGTTAVEPPSQDPDIAFDPAGQLDLGAVLDNGATVSGSFEIQNVGQADLTISSITSAGDAGFNVVSQPADNTVIAASGSETVSVEFTPTVGDFGVKTLTFTVNSDDPDEASATYDVTINVSTADPDIDVTPASLDYGVVQPGSSASQSITISNNGLADLTVSALTLTGDAEFSLDNPPALPLVLAPSASAQVSIEFAPASDGAFSGSLDIVSNDADEGTVSVALAGVSSTAPPIAAVPAPFASSLGDDPNIPTVDNGDYFMVEIRVGSTGNPVSDFFGVGGELNWDPAVVELVTLDEFDVADNDPAINPAAASNPAGSHGLQNPDLDRGAYVASGAFISEGNSTDIIIFEETSEISNGKLFFTSVRQAPAPNIDGIGSVARIAFRVLDDVIALGSGASLSINFTLSDVQATSAGASFLALTLDDAAGELLIIDRAEVWPGDTDDNGEVVIVNPSDIFPIAQCFQVATNARAAVEIDWAGKDALPSAFPGGGDPCTDQVTPNPIFADANGSGDIDQNDVLAIGVNLGQMQPSYATAMMSAEGEEATVEVAADSVVVAEQLQSAVETITLDVSAEGTVLVDVVVREDFLDRSAYGDWLMGFEGSFDLNNVPEAATASIKHDAAYFEQATLVLPALTQRAEAQFDFSFSATRDASKADQGWGGVSVVEGVVAKLFISGLEAGSQVTIGLQSLSVAPNGAAPVSIAEGSFGLALGTTSVAVEEPADETPSTFELGQNYPNPFNPQTTITYALAEQVEVRLAVFDMLGRQVATLLDGVQQAAGRYEVQFDARDLPSGTYFYQIAAGSFVQTGKMQLIK